jgi:oligopeptide/dipeptide ABC transporter ATP-binding protein
MDRFIDNLEVKPLLEVKDLTTTLDTSGGVFNVVDHISFSIGERQTLGLVGESGCGKSMTALSLIKLIPTPPARNTDGEVLWKGTNILTMPKEELRKVRGAQISMVFQEPMTSMDPAFTIGQQIIEAITAHRKIKKEEAARLAEEMLERVQIPSAGERMRSYPHQLSGGLRQRAMIAMALCLRPDLLIADEPTTALDVTVEAQIMELIKELQKDLGMSLLLISHNLGLVAEICQRTAIMYAGQIVEIGPTEQLMEKPQHPYTHALFLSIPRLDEEKEYLSTIPGHPPALFSQIKGCRFRARCSFADEKCQKFDPSLLELESGHGVRCWYPLKEK